MSDDDSRPLFTYDHYETGRSYGMEEFTFDNPVLAKWQKVYPGDGHGGIMPGGMLAMIVLDAVLKLHSPRPPGGIHAGQTFEVLRLPRLGESMLTEVICIGKEIRKERRFVRVRTRTCSLFGEELFTGTMITIVAA